ncbi:MAG: hypothetical protein KJ718_02630 [Nanoarchaeota archaeon]|nr:hypothetical protein [Nanoarchaeota archaeon]MBU1051425.1 hypothetical protein [Nanoarchaeota archaeon]MBU1988078.1 hypothetical protein [Nanoarchaeota archaeon]
MATFNPNLIMVDNAFRSVVERRGLRSAQNLSIGQLIPGQRYDWAMPYNSTRDKTEAIVFFNSTPNEATQRFNEDPVLPNLREHNFYVSVSKLEEAA